MSIASLLLGLPGAVKRLRGHNAPKMPLHLPCPSISHTESPTNQPQFDATSSRWRPAPVSHEIEHSSLNNSSVVSVEAVNLSGPGAFDGVWLMTRRTSNTSGYATFEYDIEVLVDGVDVAPAAFAHQGVIQNGAWGVLASAAAGAVSITPNNSTTAYRAQWERASAPIPFKSSLVVNLIHRSSNVLTLKTKCWVNAWQTE